MTFSKFLYRLFTNLLPVPGGSRSFLKNKNIFLSGKFFPANEEVVAKAILKRKANFYSEITSGIDYRIIGEEGDQNLIEETAPNVVVRVFREEENSLEDKKVDMEIMKYSKSYNVPLGI